jgi:hypothetical protein
MLSIITGFFDFRRQMNGLMEENRLLREELIGLYGYCEFLKKERKDLILENAETKSLLNEEKQGKESTTLAVHFAMREMQASAERMMAQSNDLKLAEECRKIIGFVDMMDGKRDA